MGTQIKLTAADGHQPDAYFAEGCSPARGAIVLVQEIFGVNSHIRSVADDYAAQSFHVVAPAVLQAVVASFCMIFCTFSSKVALVKGLTM